MRKPWPDRRGGPDDTGSSKGNTMTWSLDGGLYLVYAILHLAAAFLGLLHAFARVRTANACSRSCYRFVPHAGSVAVKLVIRDSWWGFETRTSRFVARRSLAVSPRPRSRDCQCHRRSLSRHPRVSPRFRRRLRRASKTENLRYTPKSRPESHITTPHTPRQKAKADISAFAPRTERLGFRLNVAPAARASERRAIGRGWGHARPIGLKDGVSGVLLRKGARVWPPR